MTLATIRPGSMVTIYRNHLPRHQVRVERVGEKGKIRLADGSMWRTCDGTFWGAVFDAEVSGTFIRPAKKHDAAMIERGRMLDDLRAAVWEGFDDETGASGFYAGEKGMH